ncbi:MAG: hypothetical protein LAT84_00765 [Balneolia bacterium]|nr:hypothetical protein [Balneolia bacterium]
MLVVLTFLLFVSIQLMLITLFPYSGTGYLISIPLSITITSVVLFAYYWLNERIHFFSRFNYVFATIALLFIGFINLEVHVPEGEPSARVQVQEFVRVALDYENIQCTELSNPVTTAGQHRMAGGAQRHVAVLHKCQDQIRYDGSFSVYNRTNSPRHVVTNANQIQEKLETPSERYFWGFLDNWFND